jgi:hypothetical protein
VAQPDTGWRPPQAFGFAHAERHRPRRRGAREEVLRLLVKTLPYTLQLSLDETNDPLPSSETA